MVFSIITTLLLLGNALAQSYTGPQDARLVDELVLDIDTNGVSTTPSGRLFMVISHVDGSTGTPSVVEFNRTTNTTTAYPDAEWNSYASGKDPATHFVSINSQRIGPDGNLYVVDTGAPGFGVPAILPGGPKLVQVNITTSTVTRVYSMDNATRSDSFLDDVRFHTATGMAYLTDAGSPGFIVLNLATGETRRVLDNDLSTRQYMPVSAEGTILQNKGKPDYIYNDQLEVSPCGKYLYFQPASGGMSVIETKYLEEAYYNSSMNSNTIMDQYVQPYAHTPSTGGTAIDAKGVVYVSDTDSQRIISIAPNGTMTTLVQDPRLLWVDAMWVDTSGKLWMPAAQLNRGTAFNNGTSYIVKPLHVFTLDIGTGPSPIDHA